MVDCIHLCVFHSQHFHPQPIQGRGSLQFGPIPIRMLFFRVKTLINVLMGIDEQIDEQMNEK